MGIIISLGSTAGLALAASSQRAVVAALAPANLSVKLKEWSVWFDGTLSSSLPVDVQLCRMTTLGNMSTATVFGEVVRNGSTAITPLTIGRTVDFTNTSSEPGSSGILARRYVHPQVGYHEKFPYGEEILVNNALCIGITVLSVTTITCKAEMIIEE